jgi:polysaccharide chain length determinant protein (PEP-CTERM system associated)
MMTDVKAMAAYHARRLWRRRWSALAAAWIVCVVGWTAVALLPNKFGSHAQIYVDTDNLLKPLLRDMAVQPDVNSNIEVVRRTLLSPESLTEVVLALGQEESSERVLKAASQLSRSVTLISDNNARNLFTVSYRDAGPKRAKEVVEQIVQLFIRKTRGISEDAVTSARSFIEQEIKNYEARLIAAEQKLATFRREHATELTDVSAQAYAQQEGTIEAEISRLTATYESKMWQRDQLKTDLARTSQTLSSAVAATLVPLSPDEQRLQSMKNSLASLRQIYKDEYPDIIALKREIAAAEANLTPGSSKNAKGSIREGARAANPTYRSLEDELRRVEADVVSADRQIQAQRTRLEQLRRGRADVPEVEQQLAALNRDYDVLKKNYAGLIERREAANLSENIEAQGSAVAFRVIEKPSFSNTPVWPPRNILYPAVAILGIAVGLGLAFVRYFWSDLIATLGDVAATAPGLPLLGALTRAPVDGARAIASMGGFFGLSFSLLLCAAGVSLFVPHFHDMNSAYDALREAWWSLNSLVR